MRTHRRLIGTLALIGILVLSTAGFKACPQSQKDKNIAFAHDVADAFISAAPIIAKDHPNLAAAWTKGGEAANKLIDAVAADNKTSIVALLADIMPVFTQVAQAYTGNTTVLTILALADIALHFFANHFVAVATGKLAATGAGAAIARFKAQPQFGCQYRPDRCR